jgi:hypothetical protein
MNKALEKQGAAEQATHVAKAGSSPDVGGLWGVSLWVHDAIKAKLSDPDSYKFIEVMGPWPTSFNGQDCRLEKVHFRAKNPKTVLVATQKVWPKFQSSSTIQNLATRPF